MTLHPRLTRATIALVERFETFQPLAEPTPGGGWSVGYGHTASAREGVRIDRADAATLLLYDLDRAARAVERVLFAPVTQPQFEALTALCFNLGEDVFRRSTALARVNAGAELDAADEFERWRQAELGAGAQVVDALVRRRAAEKAHFLKLPEGAPTSPSAQLRPLAEPGGEVEPPTEDEVEAPTSAALIAVNGVQARLRRLIPDQGPDEAAPAGVTSMFEVAEALPHQAASAETPVEIEPYPAPPSTAPPEADWELRPPPFDPVQRMEDTDVVLPPVGPMTAPHDHETPPLASTSPASASPTSGPPPPPVAAGGAGSRATYVVAGLLGLAIFAVGVAMILGGRPTMVNLALGAIGAALAMAGLYGWLGRPRPADPPRQGEAAGADPS